MKKYFLPVIILISLLLSSSSLLGKKKWELEKTKCFNSSKTDCLKIMTRKTPGSSMKEFKGELIIHSSIDKIIKILKDHKSYPKWFKDCKRLDFVKKFNNNSIDFYSIFDADKFGVSARDVFFRCKYVVKKKKGMVVDFKIITNLVKEKQIKKELGQKNMPVKICSDCERISELKSLWHLEKIGDNKIKVLYQSLSNPEGWIPSSLANAFAIDQPFDTLLNLKKMSEKK